MYSHKEFFLSLSPSLNLLWFAGTFLKESIHLVKEHAEICMSFVVPRVANIEWNRCQQDKNLKRSWDLIHAQMFYPVGVVVDHLCCILILEFSQDCTLVRRSGISICLYITLLCGDIQFRHIYVISVSYWPFFGRRLFCPVSWILPNDGSSQFHFWSSAECEMTSHPLCGRHFLCLHFGTHI